MIEDESWGHSWTNAFLGIKAKEIHVCGDERALGILASICENTGDILYLREYGWLSNLLVENKPFKSFKELREGDCVVGFSWW